MKAHGSVSCYLSIYETMVMVQLSYRLWSREVAESTFPGRFTKKAVVKLRTANDNSCKLEPVENHQTGTHNFQD